MRIILLKQIEIDNISRQIDAIDATDAFGKPPTAYRLHYAPGDRWENNDPLLKLLKDLEIKLDSYREYLKLQEM
jgi:hypothetical protein